MITRLEHWDRYNSFRIMAAEGEGGGAALQLPVNYREMWALLCMKNKTWIIVLQAMQYFMSIFYQIYHTEKFALRIGVFYWKLCTHKYVFDTVITPTLSWTTVCTCWKNWTLRYPNGGTVTASFWPKFICWNVEPSGGKFLVWNFSGCLISRESRYKLINILHNTF